MFFIGWERKKKERWSKGDGQDNGSIVDYYGSDSIYEFNMFNKLIFKGI